MVRMRKLKTWIALLLGLCTAVAQGAGLDARWGLQWGQTVAEVRAKAVGWRLHEHGAGWERYLVQALPSSNPAFPTLLLLFRSGRLAEVSAFSVPYRNDGDGSLGRIAYSGAAMALAQHYGPAKPIFEVARPRERQPAAGFYACLKQEDCGMWMRYWDHPESFVHLELSSRLEPQTGWLVIRAVDPAQGSSAQAPGGTRP